MMQEEWGSLASTQDAYDRETNAICLTPETLYNSR